MVIYLTIIGVILKGKVLREFCIFLTQCHGKSVNAGCFVGHHNQKFVTGGDDAVVLEWKLVEVKGSDSITRSDTHTPPPPPPPNSLEMYCTKDYLLNHWCHVLVLGNSLGMRWILQLLAFCGMIPPTWAVVTSLYVLSGSELACRSSTPSPELSSSPYNSGKTQNNSDIMWFTKSQSIPQSKQLLYE